MRISTIILVISGALLSLGSIVVLVFWFAFPRWYPEIVITYSPSLNQALLANTCLIKKSLDTTVPQSELLFVDDYMRFERRLGDGIYGAMAACDDGMHGERHESILRYLGNNLNHPRAQAMLWAFSDQGDKRARRLVYRAAQRLPQGIDAAQVLRASGSPLASP